MASTDPVGAAGSGAGGAGVFFFSFAGGTVPAVLVAAEAADTAGGDTALSALFIGVPLVLELEAGGPVGAGAVAAVADADLVAGTGADGGCGGSWPAMAPPSAPPPPLVAGAGGVVICLLCPKKIRDVK